MSGATENVVLSAAAARQRYLLPLLGKARVKDDPALAQAAQRIAAYRAYRDALTKP